MIELHWSTRRCGAGEALDLLRGRHTMLVATPTAFTVAVRGADGVLRAPQLWVVPDDCFQLTAFDADLELRWLREDPDGTGRAVWLSEDRARLPDAPPGPPVQADLVLPDRALLWGEPEIEGVEDGFSRWSSGRVGVARYPVRPGVGQDRVCLDAVEYVAHDEHGNANVVERRLVALHTVDLALA